MPSIKQTDAQTFLNFSYFLYVWSDVTNYMSVKIRFTLHGDASSGAL